MITCLPEQICEEASTDDLKITLIRRLALNAPFPPGTAVKVFRLDRCDGLVQFAWTRPDDTFGGLSVHDWSIFQKAQHCRDTEAANERNKHFAMFRFNESQRIAEMTPEEIIAEGVRLPRYGGAWRALKNPLILRPKDVDRLKFGRKNTLTSRQILRWLDEQGISVKVKKIPLSGIRFPPRYGALFKIMVLDFSAPHAPFYFRVRWL